VGRRAGFAGLLLGPPAVANLVSHLGRRISLNRWLRFFSATVSCWIASIASLLGNIAVDEAIVGVEAGKPFYMTPPPRPNQRVEAMTRSAVTLLFQLTGSGALLVMPHPYR